VLREGKFPVKVPLREDKTGAHDVIGPRPLPRPFALHFFPRRYSRTLRQTNGTARSKASIRIRLIRIRFADRPTLLTSLLTQRVWVGYVARDWLP
jgi:hypothetical protein